LENQTHAITVNVADINNSTLTYSIVDSLDSQHFDIDSDTGMVSFYTAPDFENPIDLNSDNIYEFEVKVTNIQGNFAAQKVKVFVLNQEDITLNLIKNQMINTEHTITVQLSSTTNLSGNVTYEAQSLDTTKISIQVQENSLIITSLENINSSTKVMVTSIINGFSDKKIFNVEVVRDTISPTIKLISSPNNRSANNTNI